MRIAFACALAITLVGCAPMATTQRSSREPAIDGQEHLLSKSALQAVLTLARNRLAVVAPLCSINRVSVLSATKVEAHFCENESWLGMIYDGTLTLKRIHGLWKVTDQRDGTGRLPRPEEIII